MFLIFLCCCSGRNTSQDASWSHCALVATFNIMLSSHMNIIEFPCKTGSVQYQHKKAEINDKPVVYEQEICGKSPWSVNMLTWDLKKQCNRFVYRWSIYFRSIWMEDRAPSSKFRRREFSARITHKFYWYGRRILPNINVLSCRVVYKGTHKMVSCAGTRRTCWLTVLPRDSLSEYRNVSFERTLQFMLVDC